MPFELFEYLSVEIYRDAFIRPLYVHKKTGHPILLTFKVMNILTFPCANNSALRFSKHNLYTKTKIQHAHYAGHNE